MAHPLRNRVINCTADFVRAWARTSTPASAGIGFIWPERVLGAGVVRPSPVELVARLRPVPGRLH